MERLKIYNYRISMERLKIYNYGISMERLKIYNYGISMERLKNCIRYHDFYNEHLPLSLVLTAVCTCF